VPGVLFHRSEIESASRQDIPRVWPSKRDGKTTKPHWPDEVGFVKL
jgi:hypothetical protein